MQERRGEEFLHVLEEKEASSHVRIWEGLGPLATATGGWSRMFDSG